MTTLNKDVLIEAMAMTLAGISYDGEQEKLTVSREDFISQWRGLFKREARIILRALAEALPDHNEDYAAFISISADNYRQLKEFSRE